MACLGSVLYDPGLGRKLEVSPAVRPFSGLRAPRRGPLGWSREIAGSRRAARHAQASPSRAPRDRGTASGRRNGRSGEAVSAPPVPSTQVPRRSLRGRSPGAVTSASTRLPRSIARLKTVRGGPARSTLLLPGAERRGDSSLRLWARPGPRDDLHPVVTLCVVSLAWHARARGESGQPRRRHLLRPRAGPRATSRDWEWRGQRCARCEWCLGEQLSATAGRDRRP